MGWEIGYMDEVEGEQTEKGGYMGGTRAHSCGFGDRKS
jgi:hypothetical protein